jgi:hypothetical protein
MPQEHTNLHTYLPSHSWQLWSWNSQVDSEMQRSTWLCSLPVILRAYTGDMLWASTCTHILSPRIYRHHAILVSFTIDPPFSSRLPFVSSSSLASLKFYASSNTYVHTFSHYVPWILSWSKWLPVFFCLLSLFHKLVRLIHTTVTLLTTLFGFLSYPPRW